jgi:hypothetical protein
MKRTKGTMNSSGKAMMTAALIAVAAMAMPSLVDAQSRFGDRGRVAATAATDGGQQTRRERRRERLDVKRERIRGRVTERREARRERRSERRVATQQRHERWRGNRQNRYQQWRGSRPATWRRNNVRHPAYRTQKPRRNYYARQRQQNMARYNARQRYNAWQRHQGQRTYARRPVPRYGYRHRISAPANSWNLFLN